MGFVDPRGLDTYIINRDLAVVGNSARSRSNPITHTFTAITTSGGIVSATYSWGNEANLHGWNLNQNIDMRSAQEAINKGLAEKVGDASFDPFVRQAYSSLNKKEYEHYNWFVANNCKAETTNLINKAKDFWASYYNPQPVITMPIGWSAAFQQ